MCARLTTNSIRRHREQSLRIHWGCSLPPLLRAVAQALFYPARLTTSSIQRHHEQQLRICWGCSLLPLFQAAAKAPFQFQITPNRPTLCSIKPIFNPKACTFHLLHPAKLDNTPSFEILAVKARSKRLTQKFLAQPQAEEIQSYISKPTYWPRFHVAPAEKVYFNGIFTLQSSHPPMVFSGPLAVRDSGEQLDHELHTTYIANIQKIKTNYQVIMLLIQYD